MIERGRVGLTEWPVETVGTTDGKEEGSRTGWMDGILEEQASCIFRFRSMEMGKGKREKGNGPVRKKGGVGSRYVYRKGGMSEHILCLCMLAGRHGRHSWGF